MRKFIINETERERILNLHQTAIKKQNITETLEAVVSSMSDPELQKYNKAIQCFLNKKGVTDDNGNKLVIDGSIGNYPNSKSAQAIYKYQKMVKAYPVDGKWGQDTMSKMSDEDKKMYKECLSQYEDIIDKIINFFL